MIKERKKKSKYNVEKTQKQILIEYVRTILVSLFIGIIVTSLLAMQARNEMIENIYLEPEEQQKIDREQALQLITKNNLLEDLNTKKYSVCLHIGELFEAAGDYKDAQIAYEYAIIKAKQGQYKPYYSLIRVLVAQENFDEAENILNNIVDFTDKKLIKFKTRAYLTIGDKYYSIGKFLSAAKSYEKAEFYYNKFSKKDKVVLNSITERITYAYLQTADVMVASDLIQDAIRFLKVAEKHAPDSFSIKYKLALVLSDYSPEESIKYFEDLLDNRPQDVDFNAFSTALMKAANLADLDGDSTKAKYYRYKIRSLEMLIKRKVVYKNDIDTFIDSIIVKKVFFTYPILTKFTFTNISTNDITSLTGDFVLTFNGKPVENVTKVIATKKTPLICNGYENISVNVDFNRKVFTRKELENYTIKIYLYKDPKFKTLNSEIRIPKRSYKAYTPI